MKRGINYLSKLMSRLVLPILAMLLIASCSSGGSCNGCSPANNGGSGQLSLSLSAPNQFPANMQLTAYLTLTNTSGVDAKELVYNIPEADNQTGTLITVTNGPSNPCLNINAGDSCTFPVIITNTPTSHPGSFKVIASTLAPSSGSILKSILKTLQSAVGIRQGVTLTLNANIGLTTLPVNTQNNANGITFLYAQTIPATTDSSGLNLPTLLSIVAIVNSPNASESGGFNTINLTDSGSNLLNFQVLSGNSGNNKTNLATNAVVSFLLTIPSGVTNYQFYAQTAKDGTVISQGTVQNPINITTAPTGILVVQPTNFNLYATESYESQLVTYTNIGNASISGLSIVNPAGPISMTNNCNSNLAAGAACTVLVSSSASAGASGTSSLVASYSGNTVTSTFNYAGINPESGVQISSSNNFIFATNSVAGSESAQITIYNSGNVNESNFIFNISPSTYFTLSSGTSGTPCTLLANTVTNTLAPGNSCTITLTYANSSAIDGSATISANYKYSNQTASTPPITITYETSQATAALITTPASPYTFSTIIANGIESKSTTFSITNNGPDSTSSITTGSITGDSAYFSVVTGGANDCSNHQTLAASESCTITVRFGPNSTAKDVVATLPINYVSTTGGGTLTTNLQLNGTARNPVSANVVISNVTIAPTPTTGNGESVASSFEIGSALTPTTSVTLTYKNTGDAPANNFSINSTGSAIPAGYNLVTSNCDGSINLQPNSANQCQVVLQVASTTPGPINLIFSSSTLGGNWTDEDGPSTNEAIQWSTGTTTQSTVYIEIFPSAAVSVVMSSDSTGTSPIINPIVNTDFYIVYTLTGGYNVNMTYEVDLSGTPGTPPMSVAAPTTCSVTTNAPTCSIKISSGGAATNQNISYVAQGSAITPSPESSGNFNVIRNYRVIFAATNSSLGYTGDLGGVSGADAKCVVAAPFDNTIGSWKAMLVDGTNRVACTTANCSGGNNEHVNWVFAPNTQYRQVDEVTPIQTSDVNALLPFDLNNSFTPSPTSTLWTGLTGDWQTAFSTCGAWTLAGTGSDFGAKGSTGMVTSAAISLENHGCNQTMNGSEPMAILCVQQPPTVAVSVASTPQPGINTANSCTAVTATLLATTAATTATSVDFSIPAGSMSGTSKYYFASAYNGTAAQTTSCTISAGGTTCNAANLLCAGPSAAGTTATLTAEATGYSNSTIGVTARCSTCSIFVTNSFNGGADLPLVASNLGAGSFTDGFAAGDAICTSNATSNSYPGVYKALIAGTNRQPGGSDWVIYANTPYVRTDATTPIGTSTAGAQLPASLTHAISPSVATPVLDGFASNTNPWVLDTTNGNCSNWTSAGSGFVTSGNPTKTDAFGPGGLPPGVLGYLGTVDTSALIGCSSITSVLYCVQQ